MKKEANIQRMAEKQKEAKLAVCAIFLKLVIVFYVFVMTSLGSLYSHAVAVI